MFLSILIPSLATLHADTVVLKSGESLTGNILSQTAEALTIEYKVSASISDQKVIPMEQVAKIEKVQPDEVAYASVQSYKVDPEWSMQPENYDRIAESLNEFLIRYPNSSHAEQVKKNLGEITAEKARVEKGEMKFFGNWLTKEQASKQQSQIQAQTVFASMRDQGMRGDLIGALTSFEVIKTTCKTALIYPAAVQFAGSLMQNLERQIAAQKQELLREDQNWDKTIALSSEPTKSQLIASRAQMAARAEAALAAATKSGVKWTPIIPHSRKSLEAIERTLSSEKTALASIPVAKMRQSIDYSNKATDAVAGKDLVKAEAYMKDALALWPENSALTYVKNEITALRAVATPTPTPTVPATSTPELAKKVRATAPVAASRASTPEPEPPFYMTPLGASLIVGALLAVIGIGSLVARISNKPKEE